MDTSGSYMCLCTSGLAYEYSTGVCQGKKSMSKLFVFTVSINHKIRRNGTKYRNRGRCLSQPEQALAAVGVVDVHGFSTPWYRGFQLPKCYREGMASRAA